ncbi:META domain-containing protein [Roseovarius sp. S4756]|uniref:META domain-containing protein n=1 Tax=Roseovarius maritimus TaxID=3342637 RepID=UPI003727A199
MKRIILGFIILAATGIAAISALVAQDRDSPALTGGPWGIEYIGDRGVIDRSPATLSFQPDGALAGNASCNRLVGEYTAGPGGAMELSPTATTRMACLPALMEQEQRLLALLPEITRYEIDRTGALVLTAPDGQTIRAHRRKDGAQ